MCTGDNRKLRTIVCNHSKEKERYRNPPRDKDLPCLSDHWLSFSSSSSNNNNNLIGPSTTKHCAIIYVPCNTWPRNFVPFNSINTEKKIMDTSNSLFYLNTCSVSLLSTCVDRILPCPVWLCHQLHGSVVLVANPWTLWLNSVRVAMSTMSRRLLLQRNKCDRNLNLAFLFCCFYSSLLSLKLFVIFWSRVGISSLFSTSFGRLSLQLFFFIFQGGGWGCNYI